MARGVQRMVTPLPGLQPGDSFEVNIDTQVTPSSIPTKARTVGLLMFSLVNTLSVGGVGFTLLCGFWWGACCSRKSRDRLTNQSHHCSEVARPKTPGTIPPCLSAWLRGRHGLQYPAQCVGHSDIS